VSFSTSLPLLTHTSSSQQRWRASYEAAAQQLARHAGGTSLTLLQSAIEERDRSLAQLQTADSESRRQIQNLLDSVRQRDGELATLRERTERSERGRGGVTNESARHVMEELGSRVKVRSTACLSLCHCLVFLEGKKCSFVEFVHSLRRGWLAGG
jgi:DNA repair exonuclease SbcCD ATPase subunit